MSNHKKFIFFFFVIISFLLVRQIHAASYLNSASGKTCATICAEYNVSCLSAGLTPPAYNDNLFWSIDMGECGTQRSDNLCSSVNMTSDLDSCEGQAARWTYCNCGGATLTPTPTNTPGPTLTPTPTFYPGVYLNQGSGLSCTSVCSGYNKNCQSVGLNAQANDSMRRDYITVGGCHSDSGTTCSTTMDPGFTKCEGNTTEWTFCKCSTAPACPPNLVSPANGAVSPSKWFNWTKCSSATHYNLRAWGNGIDINKILPANVIVPYAWTEAGFQRGKQYSWQVCSCTNSSCSGTQLCSPTWTFWYLAHPVPTKTPTPIPSNTPPPPDDCNCVSDSCTSACVFDKYNPPISYAAPIQCVLSDSLFSTSPTPGDKNLWCQRNQRTKGDADGQVDGLGHPVSNIDYMYYVRAVNGGKLQATVNPDFNGDGEVGSKDREIIIKTLNP